MSTGYKIAEKEGLYYLTFQIVGWVDLFTPVRAGIVEKPEEYIYSSARNYAELESKIEIIKADILWKTI